MAAHIHESLIAIWIQFRFYYIAGSIRIVWEYLAWRTGSTIPSTCFYRLTTTRMTAMAMAMHVVHRICTCSSHFIETIFLFFIAFCTSIRGRSRAHTWHGFTCVCFSLVRIVSIGIVCQWMTKKRHTERKVLDVEQHDFSCEFKRSNGQHQINDVQQQEAHSLSSGAGEVKANDRISQDWWI